MKKFISVFLSLISVICIAFAFVGCGKNDADNKQDELPTEIDGAYFLTDESYEKIIRDIAKQFSLDEAWIKGVLNGGDGGDYSFALRPQTYYYCVIVGNKLTYSSGVYTVYNLQPAENGYKGVTPVENDRQIECSFKNAVLNLTISEETYSFKKRDGYTLSENGIKFSKLNDYDRAYVSEDASSIDFQWNYLSEYGWFGMAVEIKTATASEYKTEKIEHFFQNMYIAEFGKDDFEYGKNYVRFYNLGGPTITNTNEIVVYENSDHIEYCFEKSSDNKLTLSET